jgi:hypothetical protein
LKVLPIKLEIDEIRNSMNIHVSFEKICNLRPCDDAVTGDKDVVENWLLNGQLESIVDLPILKPVGDQAGGGYVAMLVGALALALARRDMEDAVCRLSSLFIVENGDRVPCVRTAHSLS